MNERMFVYPFQVRDDAGSALDAGETIPVELPYPWTLLGVKASAENDSSATIAVDVAGTSAISATAIGDSADPSYLEPSSPTAVDANEKVTLTLDFDGDGGTAATNVFGCVIGLVGDG